jgi:hypothetical protein
MFAILTFRTLSGRYPDVGTNDRIPRSDLKTERGYVRWADSHQRPYRLQLFRDRYEAIPFKTIYNSAKENR